MPGRILFFYNLDHDGFPALLTNQAISAIVCRLIRRNGSDQFLKGDLLSMRERQKEINRRRKRKEETLKLRRKTAKAEAAAKKGK